MKLSHQSLKAEIGKLTGSHPFAEEFYEKYHLDFTLPIIMHGSQMRKDLFRESGKAKVEPEYYWRHPVRVAFLTFLTYHGEFWEHMAVRVALGHDLLEDTKIERSMLINFYGLVVTNLIDFLTDETLDKGNRQVRKELDRARIISGPEIVHTVKCIDIMDNTPSIMQVKNGFSRLYWHEVSALHSGLYRAKDDIYEACGNTLKEWEIT